MLEKLLDTKVLVLLVLVEAAIICWLGFTDHDVDLTTYQSRIELLQTQIDSLNTSNAALQIEIDSMYIEAAGYEDKIESLNASLDSLKKDIDDQTNAVDGYSNSELNSYFTNRYPELFPK